METRFLHTYLTVVKTGSVAEAARRLNVTPSAVTQRIRALESEVGWALLQRSGQQMEPTPAGAGILAHARQILSLTEDIRGLSAPIGEIGHLRIGVIQTALTGLLPDILFRLRRNRPQVDLYLVPGTSAHLYAQLTGGEIDLALIVKPHFALPKSLEWMPLRQEAHLLITPPGLEVADPKAVLRREPFIRYDRNYWGGRAVDQYLRRCHIRPYEHYELDSLEAIVVMVSRGLGISIIPDWPAPWPENVKVDRLELTDMPNREVGIIWSRTSHRLPLISTVLSEVREGNKESQV
jgi:DNA-binding transcriptional LysR family regulator